MDTDAILVTGGVVAIVAGAVGGGIKLVGGDVPVLATKLRQFFVFAVGVVLLSLGLFPGLRHLGTGREELREAQTPANASAAKVKSSTSASEEAGLTSTEIERYELPSVAVVRVRIRSRLMELSTAHNVAALRQMAIAAGLAPRDGATADDLRRMIQDKVASVSTLADTLRLARTLGIPLED
ncbi:MAG TPA: hypothetical protein VGW40_14540 [Allosphingosinicella sp.]|nr:hypothetical protein [Allosphingosinicella sp.]